MHYSKQTLRVRLQLLARLTLNAGKHTANQPARLAHLDDGNDRAILVQGNEGPAQIVRLGHRATPSIDVSDEIAILAARPIASLRWREMDSNSPLEGDGFELPVPGRDRYRRAAVLGEGTGCSNTERIYGNRAARVAGITRRVTPHTLGSRPTRSSARTTSLRCASASCWVRTEPSSNSH